MTVALCTLFGVSGLVVGWTTAKLQVSHREARRRALREAISPMIDLTPEELLRTAEGE